MAPKDPDPFPWLAQFERKHGRPLRVLHIGNIANNAYNNAKIQRQRGIEADVCCPDYYHAMACPEWEDADFNGTVVDEMHPDWWDVDLGGFERPKWFAQGTLRTCRRYLLARSGHSPRAARLWERLERERWLRSRSSCLGRIVRGLAGPQALWWRRPLQVLTVWLLVPFQIARRRLRATALALVALARGEGPAAARRIFLPRSLQAPPPDEDDPLAARFRLAFPERSDRLSAADYAYYAAEAPEWQPVLAKYDIVQGYACEPAVPLVCGAPAWTAYEHGTLREIPFEENGRGRLCALAYREAPVVFVTNPDVVPAARRLGLEPDQIVHLPHAVDSDRLFRFADRHTGLLPGPGDEVMFVSPTRQDWVDRDPSWTKANDRAIRALALVRDRGLRCRLLLADWGRDLGASKALVEELGVEDLVGWIPALRKGELWKAYLRAHAVADQFALPGISGVTFEALALGRRVLAHVSLELTRSFFGEEPPLLTCHEPEEIAAAMERVIADPLDEEGLGASARSWFERYHSSERIVELQASAYRRLLEGPTLGAP